MRKKTSPGAQSPKEEKPAINAAEFAGNMAVAAEKCQLIMQEFLSRQASDIRNLSIDPFNVGGAFMELFARLASNPMGLWEKQISLLSDYFSLWQSTAQRLLGNEPEPVIAPDSKDKRFRDDAWQENAVFDFLRQS